MVVSCSSDEFCPSLEPASWPLCRTDSHFPGFLFFCPGARVLHPRPVPRKDKLVCSRARTRMAPHTGKVVVEGPPGRGPTWPRTTRPRAHLAKDQQPEGPPGQGPTWARTTRHCQDFSWIFLRLAVWRHGELLKSLGCQPGSPFTKGPGLIICFFSPSCSFLPPPFLLLTVVFSDTYPHTPTHTHTHPHTPTHTPSSSAEALRPAVRAAYHEGQRSPARECSAVGAGLWPPDCLVGGDCAQRAEKANSGFLFKQSWKGQSGCVQVLVWVEGALASIHPAPVSSKRFLILPSWRFAVTPFWSPA